jgi:hypothetical protein
LRRLIYILLGATAAIFAGCAIVNPTPGPLTAPSSRTQRLYYLGTPISGPRAGDVNRVDFGDALQLHADWFVLEKFDGGRLPLLGAQATLITARLGGAAMLPSGPLTSNARIAAGEPGELTQLLQTAAGGRMVEVGDSGAVLPRGIVACFRAIDEAGPVDRTLGKPELRYVELSVGRAGLAALSIAVSVQDRPDRAAEIGGAGPYQYETAVIEQPLPGGGKSTSILVIVPFQFSGPTNAAAAVLLSIEPVKQDAKFADAVTECQGDLQANGLVIGSGPAWTLGLEQAVDSLSQPAEERAALVYLASQSDAEVCQEVASVCDEVMLAQIAALIRDGAPVALASPAIDDFSWLLDRSAITAMQEMLAKAPLPADLSEVLTLYMGEPGRHAAAIDEVMRGVRSRRELQQRLVSENYIYLQDSSPAYRVRALEWLKARDLAPAGFDPLASPKERRQALDRALSPEQVAPTPGGSS